MAESHYLFLGYSMHDWNLRVILNRIWGAQQLDLKSWAVQRAPTDAGVREVEEALWRSRGDVDLLYVPLKKYVGHLEKVALRERGVGMTSPSARLEPEPASQRSPFVGLIPYGEEDAPFFFGREVEKRIVPGTCALRGSRCSTARAAWEDVIAAGRRDPRPATARA